jgi:histidyl-tRNA synthetase
MQDMIENAPKLMDCLGDETRAQFAGLCKQLDAAGIQYKLNSRLVRGLDYYNRTVFEWVTTKLGSQGTIAGGGRYDTLVKKLGGPDLPAAGFGMGDVTVRDLLESKNLLPKYSDGPNFYVMILGEDARAVALEDVAVLRKAGFRVEYNLRDGKFPKLIQSAETIGAQYALVYGGEEVAKGITKVRSLTDRTEASIPRTDIVPALRAVLEEGMRAILP